MNKGARPHEKIEWLKRYDGYLTEEVLPFIRTDCGGDVKPMRDGHQSGRPIWRLMFSSATLTRFSGAMLLSGSYDIRSYMNGYHSQDLYFNNPVEYLSNIGDGRDLHELRHGGKRMIIFSGQGDYEAPDRRDSWLEFWRTKVFLIGSIYGAMM